MRERSNRERLVGNPETRQRENEKILTRFARTPCVNGL